MQCTNPLLGIYEELIGEQGANRKYTDVAVTLLQEAYVQMELFRESNDNNEERIEQYRAVLLARIGTVRATYISEQPIPSRYLEILTSLEAIFTELTAIEMRALEPNVLWIKTPFSLLRAYSALSKLLYSVSPADEIHGLLEYLFRGTFIK